MEEKFADTQTTSSNVQVKPLQKGRELVEGSPVGVETVTLLQGAELRREINQRRQVLNTTQRESDKRGGGRFFHCSERRQQRWLRSIEQETRGRDEQIRGDRVAVKDYSFLSPSREILMLVRPARSWVRVISSGRAKEKSSRVWPETRRCAQQESKQTGISSSTRDCTLISVTCTDRFNKRLSAHIRSRNVLCLPQARDILQEGWGKRGAGTASRSSGCSGKLEEIKPQRSVDRQIKGRKEKAPAWFRLLLRAFLMEANPHHAWLWHCESQIVPAMHQLPETHKGREKRNDENRDCKRDLGPRR